MGIIKSLKIAWYEGRSKVLSGEPFSFKKTVKQTKEDHVGKKKK